MRSQGELNCLFAKTCIQELIRLGVKHFCIAPGSRSSPLVLACAENPDVQTHVHFDERGLGFYALGIAKATQTPTCIIVTSGSAVGNLLPSVMEAYHEHIPLLILSADRPPEAKSSGANQTCDQIHLFSRYTRFFFELPCPQDALPSRFLTTTLAHAVHLTTFGPVHLNCPFREPLIAKSREPHLPVSLKKAPLSYQISEDSLEEYKYLLEKAKRGIIILGSSPTRAHLDAAFTLGNTLGFPIFADILSQGRTQGRQPPLIAFYEACLKTNPSLTPDLILHIGERLVSKTLQEWLSSQQGIPYVHITRHLEREDPFHLATHQMTCSPKEFCEKLTSLLRPRAHTHWLEEWQTLSAIIEENLKSFFKTAPKTGAHLFFSLHHLPENTSLFIGNSLPIRDAEQFFFPTSPTGLVLGQRGLSGIDGNIAAATGIAEGLQKPLIAFIGDQTALHDINSLALVKKNTAPVLITILNNQGGGIFESLPIKAEAPDLLDQFWVASHLYDFEHAAALFHLPYQKGDITDVLPSSGVLEIKIHRTEELWIREHMLERITEVHVDTAK